MLPHFVMLNDLKERNQLNPDQIETLDAGIDLFDDRWPNSIRKGLVSKE